ncbi:hypothetical protein Kpol_1045p7 [Vanderwaltozyma polyspora DSM 70294]|uniref:BTB domain-containing protein n=1 Tax=Vanderwaltozyma polyspora (strain ATCC 22028 / DSM 70294 / BCRC 21397 / CBS 2163 / NBRC 10782 / NRRL Y-8283 / UCD 57-17) TaxID=436907 RepID=A7TI16_VANPO|nr:uncharacterized protein Kpol_1045p7 [Vanderwaltozyma polyspora DSM 70294]EDO18023.1 hypothetical protein Kpol_1045p7 [Vanderwaltozyma polyspora DSM 70294]
MPIKKQSNDINRNKRDIFGRDLSYLLSCIEEEGDLNEIDLYSSDYESGYSPLHVTLKRGLLRKSFKLYKIWKDEKEYLSHKFGGHVMNQLDREGLTPLELYSEEYRRLVNKFPLYLGYRTENGLSNVHWEGSKNSDEVKRHVKNFLSLPLEKLEQDKLQHLGGSHVLQLGSNVNYQLGTGTKDDRQNFYQINVHQLETSSMLLPNLRIRNSYITRYHSLIITSNNEIFTCGNSNRGRVGNGVIDLPQSHYAKVDGLPKLEIKEIKTSDHHTMVLYKNGDIYSWGWNYYGQLGHSMSRQLDDPKNSHNVCSMVPKRLTILENEEITSISCSKIHSCVVTKKGQIYLWGLNVGQLGSSKPSHLVPSTEYMGQEGFLVNKPVVVNFLNSAIEQVVCTEFATFIRTQGNTLHVLSNYTTRTFRLYLPKSKGFRELDAFKHFSPREIPNTIVDMKCKNPYGNNICFRYSCGRVAIISAKNESPSLWAKFSNIPPISVCWLPRHSFKQCLDFDVGSRKGIILSTIGGDIYTSKSTDGTFEKIFSEKIVSGRIISVSCDSQFGSFSITKDEVNNIPIIYPKDPLRYNFSSYSPIKGFSNSKKDINYGILNFKEFEADDYSANYPLDTKTINDEYEGPLVLKNQKFQYAELKNKNITSISQHSEISVPYDVTFIDEFSGEIICNCHKLLIHMRCNKLLKRWKLSEPYIFNNGKSKLTLLSPFESSKWTVKLETTNGDFNFKNYLLDVIHYLYSDERPNDQKVSRFLIDLVDNSLHYSNMSESLHNLFTICQGEIFDACAEPDVRIITNDGIISAHSMILATRSSYFDSLFAANWIPRDHENNRVVDFSHFNHISKSHFECILKYLYGYSYDSIFDDLSVGSMTTGLQFLFDLVELCDEINLEQFKNYLESEIGKYIEGSNIVSVFINAVFYNCELLQIKCAWIITSNIGILFSKSNVDLIMEYFDDEIWNILENSLLELKESSIRTTEDRSWYTNSSFGWIQQFKTNLQEFNRKFMGLETFNPSFDNKVVMSNCKEKATPRRASSGVLSGSTRRLSSTQRKFSNDHKQLEISSSYSLSNWSDLSISESSAIDDSDNFIEVVKKSKRKGSLEPSKEIEEVKVNLEEQNISVVHKDIVEVNEKLPSLLSLNEDAPDNNSNLNKPINKQIGSFKKNSQKQRKKQFLFEESEEEKKGKEKAFQKSKAAWGKYNCEEKENINQKTTITTESKKVSRPSSLPSLYDSREANETKSKKNKVPKNISKDNLHMPFYNASKLVPRNAIDVMLDKEKLGIVEPTMLSESEREAAEEFEKWFASESKKVQKQLNKISSNNVTDQLDVLYRSSTNVPGTTNLNGQSKSKKVKFPRKKRGLTEQIEI